jgi:hypothetical protein
MNAGLFRFPAQPRPGSLARGRDALKVDEARNEAVIATAMDRRGKTDHRRSHPTRRIVWSYRLGHLGQIVRSTPRDDVTPSLDGDLFLKYAGATDRLEFP